MIFAQWMHIWSELALAFSEHFLRTTIIKKGLVVFCGFVVCGIIGVVDEAAWGQESSGHSMIKNQTDEQPEEPADRLGKDLAMASLFDSTSYVSLPKGVFIRKKDGDVPAHSVVISKEIEIGIHEVTQVQWESVMAYNPSDVVNPYNPVESISWFEVQHFLDSLNVLKTDAYTYRLPTEAEWEYACLAGTVGAGQVNDVAWYNGNSEERPHPIKQRYPNSWGLYDMRGNVWEWVQDWYALYEPDDNVDPVSLDTGRARIIRGGSWWSPAEITTCSHRGNLAPDYKAIILGFRVVREIENPSPDTGS
ncbi:MAG: formylglycine-generating enzyme family protein [Rhodothermaceae bacterium]|nr:formylglycine-generating enzyme family protein [Rhodothermaceae bacterium]